MVISGRNKLPRIYCRNICIVRYFREERERDWELCGIRRAVAGGGGEGKECSVYEIYPMMCFVCCLENRNSSV